jgi:hypothetical protein
MLPPGRARLATRPLPTGSATDVITTGMTDVACCAARAPRGSRRDDDIDFDPDEFDRDLSDPVVATFRPPVLNRDVAALGPAEFA